MNKKTRLKILAILSVLAMMVVCIIPTNDSENGLDAAVGDGGSYSYTISYNSSQMSTTSAAISVANMNPINHTGSPTTVTSLNEGSWTWNTTTGKGPFNSFYAAFDMQNGNAFYAILNPYNLTKTILGDDLPTPLTRWNIMWVLPTVYISSTESSITLTNNSNGGTAYAHTIDGHTYKYIAIGVYEGSTTTLDNKTVLTSTTGTTPAASQTRATFRGYAHNYTMSSTLNESNSYPAYSMLWNFDQWQEFKLICFALMEDFNSENTVGNGHVFTNNSTYAYQTGALNTSGPYAGLPARITDDTSALAYGSDSVKLLIENAWGGVWDFVDGAVFDGRTGVYLDSSSNPTDAHSGTYVSYITWPTAIQNGYPISIQTSSARVWGFQGSTVGGSDVTGTADYIWTSADPDRVLGVGGYAWSGWSRSVQCGLSSSYVHYALSRAGANVGSRLAFVFDAGPASDLTATVDPSGYGSLGNGVITNQSTITVADIPYGSTITINGNAMTINGTTTTTLTATPTIADDHWTYQFDGWYNGASKITSSFRISQDTSITAKFTRTLSLHNALVESNNINYGTVSVGQLTNIPYGETFTVSDHTLTIYGQSVVAVEAPNTVEFQYSFDGFQTEGVTITTGMAMTKDLTIRAIFTSTQITYAVIISSNNTDYGTVDVASIMNVPGGSMFDVNGTSLEVAGTTVTATKHADDAQYTYGFAGWYDALTGGNAITSSTQVLDNMHVYARFTATVNNYTITIQDDSSGYGSVSPSSVANVPYGTVITSSNNTLNVNGTTVTADPTTDTDEYDYRFLNWTVGLDPLTSYTVTGNTTIQANFTREIQKYTVNFTVNNGDYGSVSPTYLTDVPYGSEFTVTNNVVRLNGTDVTATPAENDEEWTYTFVEWSVETNDEVEGNMTVTAYFSQSHTLYTVTVQPNNNEYGSVSNPTYSNVPYGTVITADGNELDVGTIDTSVATPRSATTQYEFAFDRWTVGGTAIATTYTVIGNTVVTADFTRELVDYTITWDIDGVTSTETYPYGSTPTHATPVKTNYDFAGWSPAITIVTGDQTYTATWTPTVYTVTFEGTGGIPTVNFATGSVESAVVLPDCILEGNYLEGWYTANNTYIGYVGDDYFPTANISLYAHWTLEVIYHFAVIYNANGGEGIPPTQTYTTTDDTQYTHDFTVTSQKPKYGGYVLKGWATTPDAESAEYHSGDTITVAANTSVTLYAVWELTDSREATLEIMSIIPYLVIVGLILSIVGVLFKGREMGMDTEMMVGVIIGATVCIIAVAFFMIPIFGNL